MIHTTTKTLEAAGFQLNGFLWTLFLNQISRFAVPMFFLISGFVLELNYDSHPGFFSYLKRRFSRIFVPYLVWSAFYFLFIYTGGSSGNFLIDLLTGGASYQLYFIPTLCIFYLIFPLLHRFYNILSNKLVLAFLILAQFGLMSFDYYIKEFTYPDPVRVAILGYSFFIIGMVSAHYKDQIIDFAVKAKNYLIGSVGVLGLYIFMQGRNVYYNTYDIKAFYSQWRPDILVYTICLGIILFYFFGKKRFQSPFFEKLSELSFFVFFVHVAVLEYIWKYVGNTLFNLIGGNFFGKFVFDPILFIFTSSISLLIAYIAHRLLRLSKLTG
jgi:surface polysaccharide O-acyltransferase-like enzyme